MSQLKAVEVDALSHRYGDRTALDNVSFSVDRGEVFGLIGPNGGGKSTTFRILVTLLKPTSGTARVFGNDILSSPARVRRELGVVFQFPGLDKKLTVRENLIYQGYLFGISGKPLAQRAQALLDKMRLSERASDRVEALSGGMKRRLEIARALLHQPKLLVLDEPTTGLDPLARREVWKYLSELRQSDELTILVTTHLLEEADACNHVALLDQGRIIAFDTPANLKRTLGGDVIAVKTASPVPFKEAIERKFGCRASVVDQEVRIERLDGHEFIPQLVTSFPDQIESVTLGKPTLEDFFIQKTGHRFLQTKQGERA